MNNLQFSITLLPSILAGVTSIFIAIILWKQRAKQSALTLFLLFVSLALWTIGYVFEHMIPGLSGKIIAIKFEYVGICWITTIWLLFCIRYTNKFVPTTKQFFLFFSWVPLISLCFVFTNEYHHLFWSKLNLITEFGIIAFNMTYGIWFWIHIGYS